MGFSEKAKLTALAIVHIFETAKPFGDYGAVAVLNDGAGVSYGINQFTHRSGSLYKVLNTYLGSGGQVGAEIFRAALPDLHAGRNILKWSESLTFKNALRAAARTDEMKQAQQMIAENFYLQPAIDACEGSGFELPLSLAVIYDSINHGSYAKIRDRVQCSPIDEEGWITEYVRKRDKWLESVPRLAVTDYRTDFFLAQIVRNNWQLDLPLNVHGRRLTDDDIVIAGERLTVGEPFEDSAVDQPAIIDTPLERTSSDEAATQSATEPTVSDQPPTFVPEDKSVDAPAPTGFMAKLKAQGAVILGAVGGVAGLKEWFNVQISPETVGLLKILLPTVLGLGFIGFLVWFVAEKVIGWKTLKLQADYATDPTRHNLVIRPK